MNSVKVAVVDDSAFMRKIISDELNSEENIDVVAKLRNGKELIEKFEQYKPDIITLDIEMPIMNGLETLKKLKELKINCPVIMLSSLTSENSVHTLECLELGATDFIEKPTSSVLMNGDTFKKKLVDKIYAITMNKKRCITPKRITRIRNNDESTINKLVKAVVIGASTGGPKALQTVLTKIDYNIGVPVFVVQHMPKGFTKAFAERLNSICKLRVVEAEDRMKIENNTIYIAQGGYHMVLNNDKYISLNEEPSIWGVRPAVDKLFESAAKVYGGNLISVVLTGMGRDGAKGTEVIKDKGGITISEDESTCTIYGMPRVAYETGKVDLVLELPLISGKINNIIKR
ncbi:two-component system, chemotaxis family, response regulator CheB [Clostridium sp. DSM 8431]|uniref:protein-glutamate methylesterase/protein-glutamine glutaminase n=1 Tax=Clostridium sp. DSM 8431 TaxID=1761781 RepID=UPI0008E6B67B|nr:chemotaxis response regulator protein-glutamate methylesterase [Clostridium sp. DSM 8431]SFU52184.1 two-component system, chemotaxis family, response regulator CheB [Clostridium sp. DSM 8431]